MVSSRHGGESLTATDALKERMDRWEGFSRAPEYDVKFYGTCLAIAKIVDRRVHSSLMSNKFSPAWLDPILDFIEESARNLQKERHPPDSLAYQLVAQIVALRFESLEFEHRIKKLGRAR